MQKTAYKSATSRHGSLLYGSGLERQPRVVPSRGQERREKERERGGGSEKAGERASLDGGRRPGCLYRSRRMSFERSHQNLICECSFPQRHSCECHSIKWKTNYSQYKGLETDKAVAMYFLLRSQFFFLKKIRPKVPIKKRKFPPLFFIFFVNFTKKK